MVFEEHKVSAMNKFSEAKKKKLVDEELENRLNSFNKLNNYYTTSSCSGRILLLRKREDNKKMPGAFYYKTHDEGVFKILKKAVNEYNESLQLWFKLEPFILHIGCRNLNSAKNLLSLCKELGIKRAGIYSWSSRIIVEIIGTYNIETLIVKNGEVLVSDEYIKTLLDEANKKMRLSKKLLQNFFNQSKTLKD